MASFSGNKIADCYEGILRIDTGLNGSVTTSLKRVYDALDRPTALMLEKDTVEIKAAVADDVSVFGVREMSGHDILRCNATGTDGVIVNEDAQNDIDFRCESANLTHCLFVDADTDQVGIGLSGVPDAALHVQDSSATMAHFERTGSGSNVSIQISNTDAGQNVYFGMNSQNNFTVGTSNNLDSTGTFVVERTTGAVRIGRPSNAAVLSGDGLHISGGSGSHTTKDYYLIVQKEDHSSSNRGATKIGTGRGDGVSASGMGHANIWMYNDGAGLQTRISGSDDPGSDESAGVSDEFSWMKAGLAIGNDVQNNLIHTTTNGTGSDVLYVGTASISGTSDERVKKNIVNTAIDATDVLGNLRVVDFNWNHPEERESCNVLENAKGTFTGLIAQEMNDHVPFAVSAPIKESYKASLASGKPIEIDTESESLWIVHYDRLVPTLIKSIQELTARITVLESA